MQTNFEANIKTRKAFNAIKELFDYRAIKKNVIKLMQHFPVNLQGCQWTVYIAYALLHSLYVRDSSRNEDAVGCEKRLVVLRVRL